MKKNSSIFSSVFLLFILTSCSENTENGYPYVDLGLSVNWATCNLGASNPEDFGDYFAWGEAETQYENGYVQNPENHWKDAKDGFLWSTYKYCNGNQNTITKYCNHSKYGYFGFTDDKIILDPSDDAASVIWGGSWRMPTKEEFQELCNPDNCTWTLYEAGNSEFNGIEGYKVTSNKLGYTDRYIFLPSSCNFHFGGSDSGYWSSSLGSEPFYACGLFFNPHAVYLPTGESKFKIGNFVRSSGFTIRPVCR